jgi:hypothetical protein
MCGCKDCKEITLFEGTPGVGIAATVVNPNGTLTLFYSDGSSFTTGVLTGPTGPMGPIGISPAGLMWQGAWVSGHTYAVNDAVSFGGASYFCYSATSGTTSPSLDTAHWALMAAQGAPGATGATGPAGTNGTNGTTPSTSPVFFTRQALGAGTIGTTPTFAILPGMTYTVPVGAAAANYEVILIADAHLTFLASGTQNIAVNLYKNGTAFNALDLRKIGLIGGTAGQGYDLAFSFIASGVNLVAGDVLTMRGYSSAPGVTFLVNGTFKVTKLT